jgi:hypothetical protein
MTIMFGRFRASPAGVRPIAARTAWRLASFAAVAGAGLIAIGLAGGTRARSCEDKANALAKELVSRPDLEELRASLAEAALLCAQGDAERAKTRLSAIEIRWKEWTR